MEFNKCLTNIFNNEDFKSSSIHNNDIKKHKNMDNAWILINKNVYSIKNDDNELLKIFKNYYGKDVKNYLLENFNNKERILLLNKLKYRKIGFIQN